jgi:hypothetical protein
MPFLSLAQNRWGHSIPGQMALKGKLHEWEKKTDYSKLPEHVVKQKTKKSIVKKLKKNR